MGRRRRLFFVAGAALVIAIATFPLWAMAMMGPAVYFDSERVTRAAEASPDGKKIASVEEIVVGGVPNIGIIIRDWWLPSWYFTGCVASSHYNDVDASLEWVSNTSIQLRSNAEPRYWNAEGPQLTLYVPGPVVRAGEDANELLVLELHNASANASVELRDAPAWSAHRGAVRVQDSSTK